MLTLRKFDLVPKNKFPIKGVWLPEDDKFDPPVTICPYGCPDVVIPYEGAETTLVGYVGIDTNHWTQYCECPKCGRTFVHEWVFSKQADWYCDQRHGKVLLGIPVCCEDVYKYPCECGGVARNTQTGVVSWVLGTPRPKSTKQCDKCGIITEIQRF